MSELSPCFGEVPEVGKWSKFQVSLRIHIRNGLLIHYIDGKPLNKSDNPIRHYFHIEPHMIPSHIASEIKAWSALSGWSIEEIIMAVRTQMSSKG